MNTPKLTLPPRPKACDQVRIGKSLHQITAHVSRFAAWHTSGAILQNGRSPAEWEAAGGGPWGDAGILLIAGTIPLQSETPLSPAHADEINHCLSEAEYRINNYGNQNREDIQPYQKAPRRDRAGTDLE